MNNTRLSSSVLFAVLAGGIFCFQLTGYAFQAVEPQPNVATPPPQLSLQFLEFEKELVEDRLEKSQTRLLELEVQRNETQNRLREHNVSEASFAEIMRLLQTQRVQLIIDLAGLDAKQELLKSRLTEENAVPLTDSAKKLNELLESYVANQRSAAERVAELFKRGTASNAEVMQARQLLIQAEIRLAESKLAQAAAGAPSHPMLGDLSATELERVEKKARLSQVETLLATYADLGRFVAHVSKLDRDADSETMRTQQLNSRLMKIDEQADAFQSRMRQFEADQN